MMFPKAKVRDAKLIMDFRKEHNCCERCGSRIGLEIAHIISKGSGGPDMRENLIMLCGPAKFQQGCHGLDHMGKISESDLFRIVSHREGITAKECRKRVRRRMGYDV